MTGGEGWEVDLGGESGIPSVRAEGIAAVVCDRWRIDLDGLFVARPPTHPVLLGLRDFFRAFRVTVDARARTTILEAYE